MRLYRLGDSGAPVRDIRSRLVALGYRTEDPPGEFGPSTEEAVRAFQRRRGLDVDGIVGPDTWRALYEAGYRLGDRILFYRRPMLRGDDVAELQRRLNALGFDAGKVDGIFGPDTLRAVLEFQENRGLAEDGTVGPGLLTEIGLVARETRKTGREAIREREWLRRLPTSAAGSRIFLDPGCGDPSETALTWEVAEVLASHLKERGAAPLFSRSVDTTPPERIRARRANRLGADLILALRLGPDGEAAYFASSRSRSEAGALLARRLGADLGLATAGKATTLLTETRAPAVVLTVEDLRSTLGAEVAKSLDRFFEEAAALVQDLPT